MDERSVSLTRSIPTLNSCLLAAVLCLPLSAPLGASYFMDPNGNDANPGTISKPWRTLDRLHEAQTILKPGDVVYFRGGDFIVDDSAKRYYYPWSAPGTAAAPITYTKYQNEKPVIVLDRRAMPPGVTALKLIYLSGNYTTVDGLSFRQTEESRAISKPELVIDGSRFGFMGPFATWSKGITIRNTSISNFSGSGIYFAGEDLLVENCSVIGTQSHAFYISGKNGVFRNNFTDGSRGYFNQQGIQIQYQSAIGNKIYGNVMKNGITTGVVLSGSVSNNEVFNNVFINSGSSTSGAGGVAIGFWCQKNHDGTGGPLGPGNKIYNNTFIGKTNHELIASGECPQTDPGGPLGRNVQIFNNIFHPSKAIPVGLTGPNVRDNVFYNVLGAVPAGNQATDPLLVNPLGQTAADAKVRARSPAIDSAAAGAPNVDFFKTPRPKGAGPDIGAHEFVPGANDALAPGTPNDLTAR